MASLCMFLFSQQKHNCNSGNADNATANTDPRTGIGGVRLCRGGRRLGSRRGGTCRRRLSRFCGLRNRTGGGCRLSRRCRGLLDFFPSHLILTGVTLSVFIFISVETLTRLYSTNAGIPMGIPIIIPLGVIHMGSTAGFLRLRRHRVGIADVEQLPLRFQEGFWFCG